MPFTTKKLARSTRRLVGIAAMAALYARPAWGQVATQPAVQPPAVAQDINVDSFYGKDPTDGVYVRDSAGAVEKLALAQKMEHLKEWTKSADLYQEVIVKYSDRVVQSQLDKDKKIYQYTSITIPVQEKLAHWPAEGLEVYRARFETPAQAMLDAAKPNDAATLNKIYALYFVTEAGKQAGIRLMDLYLENGEYPAAAWLGDRLLSLHPGLDAERSAVMYRTALAHYYAGDSAKARAQLENLKLHFPADRGTVRGKEVLLADSLSQELSATVANSLSESPDSWPTPWGDASRGRVSTAEGRPGARLYGIALSKPIWNSPQKDVLQKEYEKQSDDGNTVGVIPVTDRGELFFQDGQRIFGVNIESGVPLPGWSQTYPSGTYLLAGASGSARIHQLTVTLTEHEVLAIMGHPDAQAAMIGGQMPSDAKIVCLERPTGREKWTVALNQLPEQAKELRALQLSGSPMVVGDSVLVVAHGTKTQFEDCYVLAFELATGKYRWSTYIASASAGAMVWNGMGNVARDSDNTSHLAYANGRVYVQTNLGVLAALDAYTGAVVWLDIYPTGRQNNEQQRFNFMAQTNQMQGPTHKPWAFNPVIISDGYVFTLPLEGNHLLIYDAATGVEVKRMNIKTIEERCNSTAVTQFAGLDTLVGVVHSDLILCGLHGMVNINWKAYTDDTFEPAQPADHVTNWVTSFGAEIRGRPFLTSTSIYVPMQNKISQLLARNGRDVHDYPSQESGSDVAWAPPEEAGNVMVTNDHVVIAGARVVNVYTDLALAKAKLDKELALNPTDPQPRLRYAEIMFVAGQADVAMTKLGEAVNLLGGIKALQVGVNRDRLFSDTLGFAEKMAHAATPEERAKATAFYDLAGSAASSPMQQVHYRLSRAKFAEGNKDYAAAVALYQEILADPQLRPVPMANEVALAPLQADGVAAKAIADIMKDRPAAYESFQQAAEAAMAQALASKDDPAGKLLEIARTYPNSTVAGKAMIAAAEAFETAGDSRHAIRVLRDLWFIHSEGPDKARIQEAIARNYLVMSSVPRESAGDHGPMDNMEAAASALARAASVPGDPKLEKPLKLRDGTTMEAGAPVSKALDAVRKYRVQEAARALPDFRIPAPPVGNGRPKAFLPFDKGRDVIENIRSLVIPIHDFSRTDQIVAYTNDGVLNVFKSGEIKPFASVNGISDEPKSCAWVGKNLLVWGGSSLTNIKPEGGDPLWKIDLREMAPLEVVRINDNTPPPAEAAVDPNVGIMNNGARVVIRNGQRIILRPGRMMQPAPPAAAPARVALAGAAEEIIDVRPVGDTVLMTTSTGRILAVDLPTGKVAWQTRLSDRPVDRLVVNEDFAVVRISDENAVRIAAFDTVTGQIRCSKSWGVQGGIVPINLALAADGTLVFTMPDRLCLKDLYKPWPDATDKEMQANQGLQLFEKATEPDQLVIAEGRILALANNGSIKYVRVHSLETGQPIPLRYRSGPGEAEVDQVLEAGKSDQISLRVVGPHLYLINPLGVISYNLDKPGETWPAPPMENNPADPNYFPGYGRDSFIGQKFLVLLCQPAAVPTAPVPVVIPAPGPAPAPGVVPVQPAPGLQGNPNPQNAAAPDLNAATPLVRQISLQLFAIYPVSAKNPKESGKLCYQEKITDPAGITSQWQAVDGGFYYLAADSRLHMLRGCQAIKE